MFATFSAYGRRRRVESVRRCGRPLNHRRRVRNAKAGVDANIWIHQGWAMRKTGSVQDRLDSAVDTVISRATKLVNAAMFPVLVFDGARTTHKKETHAKRAGATGEKYERCYLPRILNEVRKRGSSTVLSMLMAEKWKNNQT